MSQRDQGSTGFSEADMARLDAMLADEGLDAVGGVETIPARPGAVEAPQSYAQELLWMFQESHPTSSAYNIPRVQRITGPLDIGLLERSIRLLADRHSSLRTVFVAGEPFPIQRVVAADRVPFEVLDVRGLAPEERTPEGRRLLQAALDTPFDLTREPAFRVRLVRTADEETLIALICHHIIFDGWSSGILMRELGAIYSALEAGQTPVLPPVPISYGDYAAWERGFLTGERLDRTLAYWRDKLAGATTTLATPADRPRADPNDSSAADCSRLLPPELLLEARNFAQANGATLYMVLVTAFQAWLARVTGQDDIVIGSAVGGRPRAETHGVIGYFSGALPLRSRFDDDPTFASAVQRVRETVVDALEHQEVPIERLTLEISRSEALEGNSLFRVVLTMADMGTTTLALGRCQVGGAPIALASRKFDLTLFPVERPGGLQLFLSYRKALYDDTTVAGFLEQIETLLTAALRAPTTRISELRLLPTRVSDMLDEVNQTSLPFPADTVPAMILARAREAADRIAVQADGRTLTYGDLTRRATQLAHRLREAGVGPDTPVGLCMDRSPELVVGLLGIWLAGAGYLPLLPEHPPARIAQLLAASGARVAVTMEVCRRLLPADVLPIALDTDADKLAAAPLTPLPVPSGDELAYVLFTSGSTGTPKGVAVTHGNLANYTNGIAHRIGLSLDGSMPWHCASVSTLAADLGHTAVFPALACGGTLHLVPSATAMEPARWADYLGSNPIDLLKITPSHLRALLSDTAGDALRPRLPGRWLILGGEPCPWPLVDQIKAAGTCRVLNHYGPTETTVGVCTFEVGATDVRAWDPATVPIGRPLPNAAVRVLDRRGHRLPPGVVGELHLGGAGVARGYLGRADLTAERFTTDAAGVRWYRTGDKVRQLPTGDIEFLGRLDDQVKVRGHRVELAEIESTLGQCSGISQAAVAVHEDHLVAFVVGTASAADLTTFLAARLPDHMIPQQWVFLDRLPITSNGKLDRRALVVPEAVATSIAPVAPRTTMERQLVAIWEEVLKRKPIGIRDDFFRLGGHSLLGIRLLGKISKATGVKLALRTLFDAPTVEALAERLEPASPTEAPVLAAFSDILKQPAIGRHDSFFASGGHSLLAIRLLARLSKTVGAKLALRTLFEHPTPALLAAEIDRVQGRAQAPGAPPTSGIARRRRDAVPIETSGAVTVTTPNEGPAK